MDLGGTCREYFRRVLTALGEELDFDMDTPWQDLPATGPQGACSTATPNPLTVRYENRYGRQRTYDDHVRRGHAVRPAAVCRGRVRRRSGAV